MRINATSVTVVSDQFGSGSSMDRELTMDQRIQSRWLWALSVSDRWVAVILLKKNGTCMWILPQVKSIQVKVSVMVSDHLGSIAMDVKWWHAVVAGVFLSKSQTRKHITFTSTCITFTSTLLQTEKKKKKKKTLHIFIQCDFYSALFQHLPTHSLLQQT